MNKNFTREINFDESIISRALSLDSLQGPSDLSLAFIKNFARNFKVKKFDDGSVQDFVLN